MAASPVPLPALPLNNLLTLSSLSCSSFPISFCSSSVNSINSEEALLPSKCMPSASSRPIHAVGFSILSTVTHSFSTGVQVLGTLQRTSAAKCGSKPLLICSAFLFIISASSWNFISNFLTMTSFLCSLLKLVSEILSTSLLSILNCSIAALYFLFLGLAPLASLALSSSSSLIFSHSHFSGFAHLSSMHHWRSSKVSAFMPSLWYSLLTSSAGVKELVIWSLTADSAAHLLPAEALPKLRGALSASATSVARPGPNTQAVALGMTCLIFSMATFRFSFSFILSLLISAICSNPSLMSFFSWVLVAKSLHQCANSTSSTLISLKTSFLSSSVNSMFSSSSASSLLQISMSLSQRALSLSASSVKP
mmetsp:Transcript_25914/g.48853  ORF Transcript_25914/g.48853 Transcript_25914/m.48853 type:complete len:365 (-) Transcript_25914:960-2054(-)